YFGGEEDAKEGILKKLDSYNYYKNLQKKTGLFDIIEEKESNIPKRVNEIMIRNFDENFYHYLYSFKVEQLYDIVEEEKKEIINQLIELKQGKIDPENTLFGDAFNGLISKIKKLIQINYFGIDNEKSEEIKKDFD